MKQSRGDALGRYEPVGSSSLQESLVESPEPHLSVKATLSVTAPSNLPEGYALTVSHNHHSYTVAIPPGGVEAGQTIQVDVPSTSATDSAPLQSPSTEPDHIPVGHWRDDAFNLFRYGVCHPSCLVSVVCPLLGAGQVIQRLRLTWNGTPATNEAQSARAFDLLVYITILHFIVMGITELALLLWDDTDYDLPMDEWPEPTGILAVVEDFYQVLYYLYWALLAWVIYRVRRHSRHRFAIPGEAVFSDMLGSCVCPCLIVSQLLRHTTDYSVHPAMLFSKRGVPDHVPPIATAV